MSNAMFRFLVMAILGDFLSGVSLGMIFCGKVYAPLALSLVAVAIVVIAVLLYGHTSPETQP